MKGEQTFTDDSETCRCITAISLLNREHYLNSTSTRFSEADIERTRFMDRDSYGVRQLVTEDCK
jgi:hypothetical protein